MGSFSFLGTVPLTIDGRQLNLTVLKPQVCCFSKPRAYKEWGEKLQVRTSVFSYQIQQHGQNTLKDTLNTKANNPVTESTVQCFAFSHIVMLTLDLVMRQPSSWFWVLRVCCTQAYRTICLPWAAAWKIQRLLLFRKMTEYLPYNPWIHTLTCSSCMASPYCSVHGVLCLQIEKKNSCTLSVLTALHTSTCSSVRH